MSKKTTTDINNADHPFRQIAIHIIEEIIEPLLGKRGDDVGLEGEEYYDTEDSIVKLIKKYSK